MKKLFFVLLLLQYTLASFASDIIGSVNGSLFATELGAAQYSVPISIKSSGCRFDPSISLVYNSNNGNDIAGLGFGLSGISSITIGCKTMYMDGVVSNWDRNGDNAFYLDGVRLVKDNSSSSEEFITEQRNYSKIYVEKYWGKHPYIFVVKSIDGTTYKYKRFSDSRSPIPLSWLLETACDKNGNIIKYEYDEYDGIPLLARITYGYSNEEDYNSACRIMFYYEDRPDYVYLRSKELVLRTNKRLSSIKCYYYNRQCYKDYVLKYNYSKNFSRLVSISEIGKNSSSYPATTFQWKETDDVEFAVKNNPAVPYYIGSDWRDMTFFSGDVDLDGKSEVFMIDPGKKSGYATMSILKYDKENGQFNTLNSTVYPIPSNFELHGEESYFFGLFHKDILIASNELAGYLVAHVCEKPTSSVVLPYVYSNKDGQSLSFNLPIEKKSITIQQQYSNNMPAYTFADIENDGIDKIIYVERTYLTDGSIHLGTLDLRNIHKKNAMVTPKHLDLKLNLNNIQRTDSVRDLKVADFDGDGVVDIMVQCSSYSIILWNDNGFSDTNYSIVRLCSSEIFNMTDINGDGLVDVIFVPEGTIYWVTAINMGTRGTSGVDVFKYEDSFLSGRNVVRQNDDNLFYCNIYDYNQDGMPDILARYKYHNGVRQYVLQGDKDGQFRNIVSDLEWKSENNVTNRNIVEGDFDGDGVMDILAYGNNITDATSLNDCNWYLYSVKNLDANTNRIVSFVDGLNKKTTITYRSLLDKYSNKASVSYPYVKMSYPLIIMDKYVEEGNEQKFTTSFSYHDGVQHFGGKGFLGFLDMSIKSDNGKIIRKKYELNTKFACLNLVEEAVCDKNGVRMKYDKYNYSLEKYNDTKCYEKIVTYHANVDVVNNVSNSYCYSDFEYGLPRLVTDDYGMEKHITYKHITDGGKWILGLPEVEETKVHNGRCEVDEYANFLTKVTNTYNVNGDIKTSKISKTTTEGSYKTVERHYYKYDTYKRLVCDSVVPYNSTSNYALTTKYSYDKYGRVTTRISKDGSKVTSSYDKYGNVESEYFERTDTKNLYQYDDMYNVVSTKTVSCGNLFTPEITKTEIKPYEENNTKVSYCKETISSSKPKHIDYYDCFGRLIMSGEIHFDGQEYVVERRYVSKDVYDFVSVPHLKGSDTNKGTTYTYDSFYRPTSVVSPDGVETTYDYSYGKKVTSNGMVTDYYYDDKGRLEQKVFNDGNGGEVWYYYTAWDEIEHIDYYSSDGKELRTSYEYDQMGRKVMVVDANGTSREYKYNAANGRLQKEIVNGKTTSYVYNKYGDITRKTVGSNATIFRYDSNRHLLSVSQTGKYSEQYKYNRAGQLTEKTRRVFVCDDLDKTKKHEFSRMQKITYCGLNTIDSVENSFNCVDAPLVEKFEYKNGWLTKCLVNSSPVWQLDGEDYFGRTSNTSRLFSNQHIVHDASGRLTRDTYTFNAPLYKKGAVVENACEYDYVGRLVKKNGFNYVYDENNQLTEWNGNTFSYDDLGNISVDGAQKTIQYDGYRLASVSEIDKSYWGNYGLDVYYNDANMVSYINKRHEDGYVDFLSYEYDCDGNRISCSKYGILEPEKLDEDGNLVDELIEPDYQRVYVDSRYEVNFSPISYEKPTHYFYIGGTPIDAYAVAIIHDQKLEFKEIIHDEQGSIIALADAKQLKRYYYDPWGRRCDETGNYTYENGEYATNGEFYRGFLGQEHIDDFGLINLNARLYSPYQGRFISPDPVFDENRSLLGTNPYSYANNSPGMYIDPSGESGIATILGFTKDLIVNTFVKSWTQGINAWTDGDNWHSTKMGFKIDMGLYKGDLSQVLSRFTWELPQTVIGYTFSAVACALDMVKDVSYYDGATCVEHYSSGWGAITIGSYINGQRDIYASPYNSLFQHEYGHYLQSQSSGWFFLQRYGIPSLIDAMKNRKNDINKVDENGYIPFLDPNITHHRYHATEQDANRRAFQYFMSNEVGFKTTDWKHQLHPIVGYDLNLPNYHIRNIQTIRNARMGIGYWDYVNWALLGYGGAFCFSSIINVFDLKQ